LYLKSINPNDQIVRTHQCFSFDYRGCTERRRSWNHVCRTRQSTLRPRLKEASKLDPSMPGAHVWTNTETGKYLCVIWGSDGGDYEQFHLQGWNALQYCVSLPTFRRNVLLQFRGEIVNPASSSLLVTCWLTFITSHLDCIWINCLIDHFPSKAINLCGTYIFVGNYIAFIFHFTYFLLHFI
jgi:hypothetical protein